MSMRKQLEDCLYKLEKCYGVYIELDPWVQIGCYRIKATLGKFKHTVYIDHELWKDINTDYITNWLEDNLIWPILKQYKRSIGEMISDIRVEDV